MTQPRATRSALRSSASTKPISSRSPPADGPFDSPSDGADNRRNRGHYSVGEASIRVHMAQPARPSRRRRRRRRRGAGAGRGQRGGAAGTKQTTRTDEWRVWCRGDTKLASHTYDRRVWCRRARTAGPPYGTAHTRSPPRRPLPLPRQQLGYPTSGLQAPLSDLRTRTSRRPTRWITRRAWRSPPHRSPPRRLGVSWLVEPTRGRRGELTRFAPCRGPASRRD